MRDVSCVNEGVKIPKYPAPADGRATAAMRADFEEAGVLVLSGFIPESRCNELRARAMALVDEFDASVAASIFSTTKNEQLDDAYFTDSASGIHFFFENEAFTEAGELRQRKHDSLNKMGHAMHDLDPVFDAFSRTPEMANLARSIGFADPLILQSMYIFKPPGIGGEVVCHQDSTYLYTEPESCVGFWFALEDATLENGCMQFIPGGHTGPLRKRNYRREDGQLVTETIDDSPWPADPVPVEAKAGTLVVFNGRAPHMSDANRSDKSRHAYTLHMIDATSAYPANNWLQRTPELPLRGFDRD